MGWGIKISRPKVPTIKVGGTLGGLGDSAKRAAEAAARKAKEVAEAAARKAKRAAEAAARKAKEVAKAAAREAARVAEATKKAAEAAAREAARVAEATKKAAEAAAQKASEETKRAAAEAQKLAEAAARETEAAVKKVAEEAKTVAKEAQETVEIVAEAIREETEEAAKKIYEETEKVVQTVANEASAVAKAAEEVTNHIVNKTEEATKHALDKTVEAANHAVRKTEEATKHALDKTEEATKHVGKKVVELGDYTGDKIDEVTKHLLKKLDETSHYLENKLDETGKYLGDRTGLGTVIENIKKENKKLNDALKYLAEKIAEVGGEIREGLKHQLTEVRKVIEIGYSLTAGLSSISLYDFKNILENLENNIKNLKLSDFSLENLEKEFKNLLRTIRGIIICPIIHAVSLSYFSKLILQTGNDFYFLSNKKLIDTLQPCYPGVDISKIKFSFVQTHTNHATTFSPTPNNHYVFMNENNSSLKLLCHEMHHSVQYQKLGGFTPFMKKYCGQIIDKLGDNLFSIHSTSDINSKEKVLNLINVHDLLELEIEADNKSKEGLTKLNSESISTMPKDAFVLKGDTGVVSEAIEFAKTVLETPFVKNAVAVGQIQSTNTFQGKIAYTVQDIVTTIQDVVAETVQNKITESVQEIVEDSIQEIVSDTVQDMVSNIVQDMDKSLENIADTVGDRVKKRFS